MKIISLILLFVSLPVFSEVHGTLKVERKENTKRIIMPKKLEKDLRSILKTNESLHHAFFREDFGGAEMLAKAMAKKVKKVQDEKFKVDLLNVEKNLKLIKNNHARNQNNQAYFSVSKSLIKIVNHYHFKSDYNIFFCPMVKMKWVQNTQKRPKVHNPYDPSMPYCGGQETFY